MTRAATPLANRQQTGFGLGLRTAHYADFLQAPQPVDWLEVITDNFLVDGGRPLAMLERIRRDTPMAMHGVAMSIGSAAGVDLAYLRRVKALADRIDALWVSDHLCWTGTPTHTLHDLYPLPYTDEAARLVIEHIGQAQDVLQRRLVLENVSSYVQMGESAAAEWEFLAHVAQQADCLLLLDVNNIYVSARNQGFDPLPYLNAMPAHRVQQLHLAGHTDHGDHVVDTHDHPVCDAVWALYRAACQRLGPVATMIERDDRIPPLAELLAELDTVRHHAQAVWTLADPHASVPAGGFAPRPTPKPTLEPTPQPTPLPLAQRQQQWVAAMLSPLDGEGRPQAALPGVTPAQAVYHHAYRARLAEVLADTHALTARYMGDDLFHPLACAYAVAHPPQTASLNAYGDQWAAHLHAHHPQNPELFELARLEFDLRTRFDAADHPALDADAARTDPAGAWLQRPHPLHPTVRLWTAHTNVAALWNALHADDPVPPPHRLPEPLGVVVWRQGLQPRFQTVSTDEADLLALMQQGHSVASACQALADRPALAQPQGLARWMTAWLENGWLRAEN